MSPMLIYLLLLSLYTTTAANTDSIPTIKFSLNPTSTQKSCRVSNSRDCPWCVKLYRDTGYQWGSGIFCMGTMIGSKVVLTTGSCMLQSQGQQVWAHVPDSANPNANYTIDRRIVHPKYNSGTRGYDLALFVLENEVQWGPSGSNGACLGFNQELAGFDILGAGIDDDENIAMTQLIVGKGTCGRGDIMDASCGDVWDDKCYVVQGAPIMTSVAGTSTVVGIAKTSCHYNPPKTLLGNLNLASTWLRTQLNTLGLSEQEFVH